MAIVFDKNSKTFFLDGKGITYAFTVNASGYPEHLYFGKTIAHDTLFFTRSSGGLSSTPSKPGAFHPFVTYLNVPAELTFFGNSDYREPTVSVTSPTGDRLTELLFDGYEILPEKPRISGMPSLSGGETLVLHLLDRFSLFAADLYYTVYDDAAVIARRIVYRNLSEIPLRLDRAYSFALTLPENHYDLLSLEGAWAAERKIERTPMRHGVCSIDSKRATSSSVLNPFLGILGKDTTETRGDAYGVSLVYSSSYVLKAQGLANGESLILGGINDFGFSWELAPGAGFETPEAVIAYSDEGLGGMSRAFHDAFRSHLIPADKVHTHRPLLINNWEGTYFNFTPEKLIAIMDAVKDTGIDTFVLDDGWFGVRNNELSGLGDWFVNTEKMPKGLTPVIEHAHALGMKFGLWFEPEMISEDSDLFRAHPDYAIGVPGRLPCYARHQRMLDLTRKDVRDYIVDSVNKVLSENAIDYVKWDYNRNVTEFFSLGLPADRQGEFSHRYALGVYDLFDRIVLANPHVFFEGCSGGGARFDPAVLSYFPQIWTSDDSDAEERTRIQYGTSIVYPLSSMSCHVSEVPNHQVGRITPLATRGDIASLGAMGYELDTTKLTEEDIDAVRAQVAEYLACEDLILDGDLYRIADPYTSEYFGFHVVAKDKSRSVLTLYRRLNPANGEIVRFKATGLDESKRYYVRELGLILSGATLTHVGLVPKFPAADFASYKFHFEEK